MTDVNPSREMSIELSGLVKYALELKRDLGGDGFIPYRLSLKEVARKYGASGGTATNAAIVLAAMLRWHIHEGLHPFYKFVQPCDHPRYDPSQKSWCEELGFTYDEFDAAIKKIGTKVTAGSSKIEAYENSLIVYWTDSERVTWWDINWINLAMAVKDYYQDQQIETEHDQVLACMKRIERIGRRL